MTIQWRAETLKIHFASVLWDAAIVWKIVYIVQLVPPGITLVI